MIEYTNPAFLSGSEYRSDGSIQASRPSEYSCSGNYESSRKSYEQLASSSIKSSCGGEYISN